MKNIIFIAQDRFDIPNEERKRIINTILADKKFQIILLVINPAENKEDYLAIEGVKNVITSLELEYMESMRGLSYEEITRHKEYQSDIETMAYRMFGDYQLSKYYYYESLCFWLRFFDEHKVDIIIHTKPYHGYMYDCCDIVAKKRGIKSFHMATIGYNNTFTIYTDYKNIPVFVYNVETVEYLLQSNYDKTGLSPRVENKNFIKKILYMIGGNLLEDFVTRLFSWNWSPRAYKRKRTKIYWSDKFLGYIKLIYTKRFMESLSCSPDYKDKYICYFLHFEPEAATQVNTELSNQLVIIKILSETMPKGWYLYVKEHPAQFDVNNDSGYSYMFDVPLFKTKKFYRKISSFPNVKIINSCVTSGELIDHAQAVGSILGSVLLESVLQRKPVLVFSDLSPVANMKEAFSIHSYRECENAMKEIKKGYHPTYSDADETVGKYVFKGEYMTENIMELLKKECTGYMADADNN